MQNNKLYSILTQFDKYEQNRLRKFIDSPYFNRNQRLLLLYDLLIDRINDKKEKVLSKDQVWNTIGHSGKLNDVKLRKDFSDLLKLVERFLAQQVYEKDTLQESNYMLESIYERNLLKLYSGAIKTARTESERHPTQSAQFFLQQYKLEKNEFHIKETTQTNRDKKNIEIISKNLDIFYFIEKLRFYCYILNSKHISTHTYQLELIDEIIEHVRASSFEEYSVLNIYYQNYLTLTDGSNDKHYFKLKELLEKHSLTFPKEEAFNLYLSTLNYCIRKINSGSKEFLEEYFEINVDFLKKEIIFLDEYLDPTDFNNIVVAALRLEKYKWVELFIKNYQKKLKPIHRNNVVTFNTARLYWYKKDHEKVIELLREVEYENVGYNLKSKIILIATYYETDEIDPLFSLLEAFRTYLNRHKEIPTSRRKNYLNLISFTKKLTKIIPGDKKAIEKIRKEINETKALVNKEWLEEKIAELE